MKRGAAGSDPKRYFPSKRDLNLKKVSLTELIPISELQEAQDSFSEVAKVAIRTVDVNGNFITNVSSLPTLCSEAFRNQALREEYCSQCLPAFLGGEGIVDDCLSFECLPGLKNYLIPLKVILSQGRSLIKGYMIVGPVFFMKRREDREYQEIAEEVGMSLSELWSHVLELRVFSYKGIHSLLEMIDNLMSRILTLAYSRLLIQKKIYRDRAAQVQDQRAFDSNQLTDFLEIFLDLITEITRGNICSVMLLDTSKKALVIKAWRGLSRDVVRGTCVKLGEGISGLAAETKKSFLINENFIDGEISDRLKRKELLSSVVVPIKCREDIQGVVNVSSDRNSAVRFDEATVGLLTKAACLAGMTLEQFLPNNSL